MKTKLLERISNFLPKHFNWIRLGTICCMAGLMIAMFFFVTAPIRTEATDEAAEASVEVPELPEGYSYLEGGRWISESEWEGLVFDSEGVSGIPGDSKECAIYEMKIYKFGIDTTYSVTPVLQMDGTPSTILYDGHAFG